MKLLIEINDYENIISVKETGSVISISDGIAKIYGLDKDLNKTLLKNMKEVSDQLKQKNIICIDMDDKERFIDLLYKRIDIETGYEELFVVSLIKSNTSSLNYRIFDVIISVG